MNEIITLKKEDYCKVREIEEYIEKKINFHQHNLSVCYPENYFMSTYTQKQIKKLEEYRESLQDIILNSLKEKELEDGERKTPITIKQATTLMHLYDYLEDIQYKYYVDLEKDNSERSKKYFNDKISELNIYCRVLKSNFEFM